MRDADPKAINEAVEFFGNWDLHKSHGRSIDAAAAKGIGIPATVLEGHLADLVRHLYHQYTLFLEKTPFCKVFENSEGIAWGRQHTSQVLSIPIPIRAPAEPTPDLLSPLRREPRAGSRNGAV